MTTALDKQVIPKTNAALDKIGVTINFIDEAPTVDEVESRVTVATSPITTAVIGSPPLDYSTRLVDGDLIRLGDAFVMAKAVDTNGNAWTPIKSMRVEFPNQTGGTIGRKWRIIAVKEHRPGDDIAAFEIQIRS